MGELPSGIVTLAFTDIEGSTRLLEHLGDDAYDAVLGQHNRILREAIAAHHGVEVSSEGDALFMVFVEADDALAAVLGAQVALARHPWPEAAAVRVRMGLNTGPVRLGGDDYVGLAVHQAARVCAAAHGGQVVVAEATRDGARAMPDGVSWRSLGRHRLKDLGAAVELFQLCHQDLMAEFPPLHTLEIVAHNLPMQASSFLGRDEELIAAAKLLAATRLLSITGPGGTGKTRLAYQLAAEHVHSIPTGCGWPSWLPRQILALCPHRSRRHSGYRIRRAAHRPKPSFRISEAGARWWCLTTANTLSPRPRRLPPSCCGRAARCRC